MRILIDTDIGEMKIEEKGTIRELPLYTPEAFSLLSRQWLRVGWAQRYSYSFTWLGRPIIQLPEDLMRVQEVIWALKPDVIIETGVAHGARRFSTRACVNWRTAAASSASTSISARRIARPSPCTRSPDASN